MEYGHYCAKRWNVAITALKTSLTNKRDAVIKQQGCPVLCQVHKWFVVKKIAHISGYSHFLVMLLSIL